MEADVTTYTKTHKRTEGAAAAEPMMNEDSSSADVDPDPICLASFGDDSTGPPALPYSRDDALVGNGAAAPKACLSPVEMHARTATGGLLPVGTASTARIIYYQSRFGFCPTEETKSGTTSIQYAAYSSYKQNRGKLWCSILAAIQVVYATVHFWERGSRCFVGSFLIGRWMVRVAGAFFGRRMTSEYHNLLREVQKRIV